MLSRHSRWMPSSARSSNLFGRPIHSTRCALENQKDGAGRPIEPIRENAAEPDPKAHSINLQPIARPIPASQHPNSASFRPSAAPHSNPTTNMRPPSQTSAPYPGREGYPQFAPNQGTRHQPSPNFHPSGYPPNFQRPNPGQPSFAPRNGYNHSFQRSPPSYAGTAGQPQPDRRTPPNFYHQARPENASRFAQQFPPPPSPLGPGFPGSNGQPARPFPHTYAPPSNPPQSFPPHLFRPPYPPGSSVQPHPGPGMPPPPVYPPPDGAFPQYPISRSKKSSQPGATLDFDFQDLAGPDALGRLAPNQNVPSKSMANNPLPFPHPSTGHGAPTSPDGRSFVRPPYPEQWRNRGPGAYPNSPQSPNFNPRNPDWSKSRPGARARSGNGPSSRTGPRPNHGLRGRGRGAVQLEPEPSLPPPPKTILDERGQYGVGPTPLGVPESISSTQSSKGLKTEEPLDDYKKIRELIAGSNTPITLPGFSQAIAFENSHLLQSPHSSEISWAHGQANKDQIVKRAFDLVIKNPSLEINQKRQTVALVDFLILSREERSAKIKSSS
ncbi:hypothetical protein PGT21_029568 [Puccinia graminis f. sp. tritici]|uniref:Uncharacterized protein n=1 Tax=Puccinia graminis f. sp. tritici TaxID=56615 RepID=A0A5B0N1N3_PUCGR|nr:hypothetical protein PGT21_029568 [Puccinia graminis f. sp. tritici]KAA1082010.1 hypothetical protein PGTUg99_032570 [Puccinia graminis f. sp. tritici]